MEFTNKVYIPHHASAGLLLSSGMLSSTSTEQVVCLLGGQNTQITGQSSGEGTPHAVLQL